MNKTFGFFTEAERLSLYWRGRIQKPGFFQFCLLPRLAGGKVAVRDSQPKTQVVGIYLLGMQQTTTGTTGDLLQFTQDKTEISGG